MAVSCIRRTATLDCWRLIFLTITALNLITITWDGFTPRPTLAYLTVKSGSPQSGGGYVLYSISNWSGEDIVVPNTYLLNQNGAPRDISHVSLFGADDGGGGGGGGVPDGGSSAILLALGTLGIAASRKFQK